MIHNVHRLTLSRGDF